MEELTAFTLSFADITNDESEAATLRRWSQASRGLVLVAGRSGSGKTTTVYTCLAEVAAQGDATISTIEGDLDSPIAGVNHTSVPDDDPAAEMAAYERLAEAEVGVLYIGTGAALWPAARRAAEAGRLVFVQIEADSAGHAIELFTETSGDAAHRHLVGSVWQELYAVADTGRRKARYEFISGPLDL